MRTSAPLLVLAIILSGCTSGGAPPEEPSMGGRGPSPPQYAEFNTTYEAKTVLCGPVAGCSRVEGTNSEINYMTTADVPTTISVHATWSPTSPGTERLILRFNGADERIELEGESPLYGNVTFRPDVEYSLTVAPTTDAGVLYEQDVHIRVAGALREIDHR